MKKKMPLSTNGRRRLRDVERRSIRISFTADFRSQMHLQTTLNAVEWCRMKLIIDLRSFRKTCIHTCYSENGTAMEVCGRFFFGFWEETKFGTEIFALNFLQQLIGVPYMSFRLMTLPCKVSFIYFLKNEIKLDSRCSKYIAWLGWEIWIWK